MGMTPDALLIGVDFLHGEDNGILIVARKEPNEAINIINCFQGKEAIELYQRLITKKGEKR